MFGGRRSHDRHLWRRIATKWHNVRPDDDPALRVRPSRPAEGDIRGKIRRGRLIKKIPTPPQRTDEQQPAKYKRDCRW
jgi:hypothetical protein